MFIHVFKYRLISMLRHKSVVGWNLLFPLVLATAFYFGFGNLIQDGDNQLKVIDIAVVSEDGAELENSSFYRVASVLSEHGENQLFQIKTTKKTEAEDLLFQTKIDGIFYVGKEIRLKVSENGINQTILSSFLKSYNNKVYMLQDIVSTHPQSDLSQIMKAIVSDETFVSVKEVGKKGASPYMNYFYSLIAMACLYGGWIGSELLKDIRADQSENGKRYECSPVKKSTSMLAGTLAGCVILSVCITVLMLYIEYGLNLPLQVPFWAKALMVFLGTILGIALGLFSGALAAKRPVMRDTLPLAVSMICSFFSGLMMGNIRQLVEEYAPVFNKINPASCITDSFYTLGTYGVGERFYINILCILAVTVLMLVFSILKMRGEAYDDI